MLNFLNNILIWALVIFVPVMVAVSLVGFVFTGSMWALGSTLLWSIVLAFSCKELERGQNEDW